MAEVKWIKIVTDVFDDEKVLLIESMPEADSIIVIWFKLLCLAGKQNRDGLLMLNDKLAYTDEMLATVFRRPVNTVRLALNTFEQFGMIEIAEGTICITNWEKHQSLDKLAQLREYNRIAQQKSREKKKLLMHGNVCQYCGEPATGYDHIIARSNGGTDDESNLIPCCKRCNSSKRDKDVVYFLNLNLQDINLDIVCKNEKLAKFARFNGKYFIAVNDSQMTSQECQGTDIEEDKEKEEDKENNNVTRTKRFTPPTVEEVRSYCLERKNNVDAQRFVDYYTSNGWLVGKNKMKDWRAAVRTWERNNTSSSKNIAVKQNASSDLDDIF